MTFQKNLMIQNTTKIMSSTWVFKLQTNCENLCKNYEKKISKRRFSNKNYRQKIHSFIANSIYKYNVKPKFLNRRKKKKVYRILMQSKRRKLEKTTIK